ncbi:MAG: hypothetical protein OXJ53_13495 [Gammaproteobacteria bacterium]|nr:hypothetical protein [Gammaproteobacteria bacterium]MDE0273967.1 hypothetical protein [Gammaproteobacteria bacterium]
MDGLDGRRWLREVEVHPMRGADERRRWDALMREHHYLLFRGLFGKSLRQVAVRGGSWQAGSVRGGRTRRADRLVAGAGAEPAPAKESNELVTPRRGQRPPRSP